MASISETDEATIDNLRQSHENPTEWKLRRGFLIANFGQYPLEQLECFSNCFINTEMYGASYPTPVMKKV